MNSNQQPVKLYIDYLSQPSRAVLAFCLFTNISHEVIEIRITEGKQNTDEFKLINPFGKVPVIDDNGFILNESHAILRYLARSKLSKEQSENWYSYNPQKVAIVDRYLDWHQSDMRQHTTGLVFNQLCAVSLGIKNSTFDKELTENNINQALQYLEENFLGQNQYIGGEQMSIADISAACEIIQLLLLGYDINRFTKISKWIDLVFHKEQMRTAHKPFLKVLKNFNPEAVKLWKQAALF